MTGNFRSWGGIDAKNQIVSSLHWIPAALPNVLEGNGLLPRGMGRSYGDSCLNDHGTLMDTTPLDHFISLDLTSGILRAEAGVTLDSVLKVIVDKGWFLPVTPGTKFVTLGGAVANDVHGKNHHRVGTFGCHVKRFELLRSDGSRTICSASENTNLFKSTIGGLGLTGLITWVELKLRPITSPQIDEQTIPFESVRDFFELSNESDSHFEHTVAWVDSLARGKNLGRGIFFRGNHAEKREKESEYSKRRTLGVPFNAPSFALNAMAMR